MKFSSVLGRLKGINSIAELFEYPRIIYEGVFKKLCNRVNAFDINIHYISELFNV